VRGLQIESVELPDGVVVEVTDARLVPMGDVFAARQLTYTHHGRPSYRLTFEVWDGVPVCTGLVIEARDGTSIRAKDLNAIRLDNIRDDTFAVAGVWRENAPGKYARTWSRSSFRTDRKHVEHATKRRKLTPEFLERVADIHKATPTARVDAVMAAFGVSERQAKRYVAAAREKGLIN
jgi:hypothetical protein